MIKQCDNEKIIRNNELEKFFEIVILSKNDSFFVDIFKNIKKRLGVVPNIMKFFVTEPYEEEKEKILKNNCKLIDNYISEFILSDSWELRDSAIILATILKEFVSKISYDKIVNIIKHDHSEYVRSCAVDYAKENNIDLLMEDIWLFISNEWNSVVRRSLLKVLLELPSKEIIDIEKEKYIANIKNNLKTLEMYDDDDDLWIIDNLKNLYILYDKQMEISNNQFVLKTNDNIDKNSLLEVILLECQNKKELQDKECYGD